MPSPNPNPDPNLEVDDGAGDFFDAAHNDALECLLQPMQLKEGVLIARRLTREHLEGEGEGEGER